MALLQSTGALRASDREKGLWKCVVLTGRVADLTPRDTTMTGKQGCVPASLNYLH